MPGEREIRQRYFAVALRVFSLASEVNTPIAARHGIGEATAKDWGENRGLPVGHRPGTSTMNTVPTGEPLIAGVFILVVPVLSETERPSVPDILFFFAPIAAAIVVAVRSTTSSLV